MKTAAALISCGLLTLVLTAPAAQAAPDPMTPDEIVELAEYGVGYSYYWGHGSWRTDGASPGSCSGSCPSCTHSGSYGADCSGFVAKVWQVPGPSALTTNSHPYSTYNFRYESQHWSQVSRSNAKTADAMVYRNDANTGGHIVLYDHGDPWGQAWTWEARGCSYGIVHNLRTIGSSYVAIRRDNLVDGPSTGTLIGSVFLDRGDGNMDTRIPGATVTASGQSTTARAGDAIWSFDLETGSHTATAAAGGYDSNSRTCSVSAGQTTWCSIGLTAACSPDCGGRACGPDGCGGSCGSCPADHACTADGQCECQPDCSGLACGPDPVCGQSCGGCGANEACVGGQCECQPDCSGLACGPDPVCGQSCGGCGAGEACVGGQCACQPDCSGLACGPDPVCGQSCGGCGPDQDCVAGQCEDSACKPSCADRECGPDPVCGQSCGQCPAGLVCSPEGACLDDGCQADCGERACGPDSVCGRSCGVCQVDRVCQADGLCDRIDPAMGKLYGIVHETLHADPADDEAAQTFVVGARVWLDDGVETTADENGYWEIEAFTGERVVRAEATGFTTGRTECTAVAGQPTECHLRLTHEGTLRDDDELVIHGGCASAGGPGGLGSGLGLLALCLLGLRRRSRK